MVVRKEYKSTFPSFVDSKLSLKLLYFDKKMCFNTTSNSTDGCLNLKTFQNLLYLIKVYSV